MSTRWVVGLGIGGHDSAAALLRDGELVAMGEQERFSRNKRAYHEAPVQALHYCLNYAGIGLDDVAGIGLGTDYAIKNRWKGYTEDEVRRFPAHDDPDRLFPRGVFSYRKLPPITAIRHHLAHAASAFGLSGFDRAAIVVVDNQGEDDSTTLAVGEKDHITLLKNYPVPVSLGLYYRTAAQFTGVVGKYKEVGKFMALASYGCSNQKVPLRFRDGDVVMEGLPDLPDLRGAELPAYRSRQLFDYFRQNCFPYTPGLHEEIMAYAHFAASIQKSLEETLLALCRRVKELTGSARLALAGGVALNCTANGMLADCGMFDEIFIQPAAHDAGVALGAAIELDKRLRTNGNHFTSRMTHAYWGPEYTQEQINESLDRHQLKYCLLDEDELARRCAELLNGHNILGWFQGRSEIGPRALGARSILGNPTDRKTLLRINAIKGREVWRPLAPAVLEECFGQFFEGRHPSPFMIVATKVRPARYREIPAVVHVDGSARPQAVSRQTNPRYWKLISSFQAITGVPIVVNTSFNIAGEPIVNTPDDAVRDFLATEMNALAIGNALVCK